MQYRLMTMVAREGCGGKTCHGDPTSNLTSAPLLMRMCLSHNTEVMLVKRRDQFPLIHFLGADPENEAPLGLPEGRHPESTPAVQSSGRGCHVQAVHGLVPQIWGKGFEQMSC